MIDIIKRENEQYHFALFAFLPLIQRRKVDGTHGRFTTLEFNTKFDIVTGRKFWGINVIVLGFGLGFWWQVYGENV
jgi:hypothetical protein